MRVNESAAASTKIIGAAAIISRALYRMLTLYRPCRRMRRWAVSAAAHNPSGHVAAL